MVGDPNIGLFMALAVSQGTTGTTTKVWIALFGLWWGTQVGLLSSALDKIQGTAGATRYMAEWRTLGSPRDRVCFHQSFIAFLVSIAAIYYWPPCHSGLF